MSTAKSALPRRKSTALQASAPGMSQIAPVGPAVVKTSSSGFKPPNPEPVGELDHSDPFTLLIAVLLSAQSTDVGVNKATAKLFAAADTPAAILALGEEECVSISAPSTTSTTRRRTSSPCVVA